jgi:Rrf2 family protein
MRLALTRRGDYAVRAALALAEAGEDRLSAAAIADRMRIPTSFVSQVMADLSRAGVASAVKGRGGVYRLARPAADVTLLDAIQASEDDRRQRTCVLRGRPCGARGRCAVHDTFVKGEDAVLRVLRQTTLADIVDESHGDPVGERG